jgi:hypothetical protein
MQCTRYVAGPGRDARHHRQHCACNFQPEVVHSPSWCYIHTCYNHTVHCSHLAETYTSICGTQLLTLLPAQSGNANVNSATGRLQIINKLTQMIVDRATLTYTSTMVLVELV